MPEGHTTHRLARQHAAAFAGRSVRVTSPQGRFAEAARLLDGQPFEGAEAYGKHLFHHYVADRVVHVHLGLFGRFLDHDDGEDPPPVPRETVRYRVTGGGRTVDLVGATACELIGPDEAEAIMARLGPDPLRPDADPEQAYRALRRRSVGIGRALMDQKVLAGVGNVFRAELLFVYDLHPDTPAREITREQWLDMWRTLQGWLRYGVRYGRIVTTTRDQVGRAPSRMRRDERVHVYRRDVCRRCDTPIRRWDLAGRWAYACETCQPPPGTAA